LNKALKKNLKKLAKVKPKTEVKKSVRSSKISKSTTKIFVEKKEDGIFIKVSNPKTLISFIDSIKKSHLLEETMQLMETGKLFNWLKGLDPPNFNLYKVSWNSDLYRVCCADYKAHSVAGSLSCGGRLNLGGSQKRKEFFDLKPFAALYFSEELDTAIKEYTDSAPLGPKDYKYKVSLKKSFDLWDYDKIIDSLKEYPNLKETVRSCPLNASWADCKVPMPSQVIACWLKAFGGDGFIFESTKNHGRRNIALIFKDDHDAERSLDFFII